MAIYKLIYKITTFSETRCGFDISIDNVEYNSVEFTSVFKVIAKLRMNAYLNKLKREIEFNNLAFHYQKLEVIDVIEI